MRTCWPTKAAALAIAASAVQRGGVALKVGCGTGKRRAVNPGAELQRGRKQHALEALEQACIVVRAQKHFATEPQCDVFIRLFLRAQHCGGELGGEVGSQCHGEDVQPARAAADAQLARITVHATSRHSQGVPPCGHLGEAVSRVGLGKEVSGGVSPPRETVREAVPPFMPPSRCVGI